MNDYPLITGLGFSVPDQVWDNHRLEKIVDTSDAWIQSRTGIVTRHIARKNETTATLAADAARAALNKAGIDALDLDVIIVATMTPEMIFPATACIVQSLIGAKKAAAFDISAACTGFIYSLSIASSMITSGIAENILVIGAETLSRIIDWTDRNTCVLFGDGAGAAVVSKNGNGCKIIDNIIHSDGSKTNLLYMPGGGSMHPASEKTVHERMHFLRGFENIFMDIAYDAEEVYLLRDKLLAWHFGIKRNHNKTWKLYKEKKGITINSSSTSG